MRFRILAALGAALVAFGAGPARAMDPGFCDHYARHAVAQFRWAADTPGCRLDNPGRWHADFRVHFDWCLSAPFGAPQNEEAIRGEHLHHCRERAGMGY
jgi:hypothetical protein